MSYIKKNKIKYTEKSIQNILYNECLIKNHKYIVPNSRLYPSSEADLLSVTSSGYINEYEIKISKADWQGDYKKKKFYLYEENYVEKCRKKYVDKNGCRIPNYFWYAVPDKLYSACEELILTLPTYCGILIVKDAGYVVVSKKAKLLHKNKINDAQKAKLANSLLYRYWNARIKEKSL